MQLKTTRQRYREYLDTLPLSTLRILGRQVGASGASSNNKDVLIEEIVSILTGEAQPVPRSNRGAPPKQTFLDPAVRARLEDIRIQGLDESEQLRNILEVASGGDPSLFDQPVYTGILEIVQGGYGFLRARNFQPSSTGEDVFVPAPSIHALHLREGDLVACTAKLRQKNEAVALSELLSVNGLAVGCYEARPAFDTLCACYPDNKFALSADNADLSLRMLDLFAPIGRGQRALIVAPPKAGKTTLLKKIACALEKYYSQTVVIVLLIDERPEEVTDFGRSVRTAQVVSSTFDESAEHHVRAARLVIEHAKRLAEQGRDVVVLLDSLTKLVRAHNVLTGSSGKTLSGGLDAAALAEPKRFFGAARKTAEAGSVTVLATVLVETGSRLDDVVFEEFKGTGNADIVLSRELAERRIFPAIDLRRTGTRKEELLLSEEELSAARKLRERGMTGASVIELFKRTEDNAALVAQLPELLKEYHA